MKAKFVPLPPPPEEFTITMSKAEALALAKLGGNLYHGPHGESFGEFLDDRHRKAIRMTGTGMLQSVTEYDIAAALLAFYFAYKEANKK